MKRVTMKLKGVAPGVLAFDIETGHPIAAGIKPDPAVMMHARDKERPTKARRKTRRQVALDQLLFSMKERVGPSGVARADFRDDVSQICHVWDGKTPLLWFSWNEGTQVLDCNRPDADAELVQAMAEAFEATVGDSDEDPDALIYYVQVGESGYDMRAVSLFDARAALSRYYTANPFPKLTP